MLPPNNKNDIYLAHPKSENGIKIDPQTATQNLLKVYHLEQTARQPQSVKKNHKTYEHHIFAPTAGARCSISPNFAWW